ncbi:MAG: DUF3105 domain-containing protein [Patescibacteria group bacterium]
MNKKWPILGGITILFIVFLAWLFIESSKPLPGTKIDDLGRGHVPIGEQVEYNSNPPTSGKHYEDWVRAGVYDSEKDDRNLVHSLEHGYIIMSYKCVIATPSEARGKQSSTDNNEIATPASGEARNDGCEERKEQLSQVYEKKGKRKLIVVSRENLDTNFALTAWTYLDKLDQFDSTRIEEFIDAHRDQGPERTME